MRIGKKCGIITHRIVYGIVDRKSPMPSENRDSLPKKAMVDLGFEPSPLGQKAVTLPLAPPQQSLNQLNDIRT